MGRVTVDRVAAEQQPIVIADLLCGLCEGVSGSEGICAAECTVGQQICLIAAESKSLLEHILGLGRSHADRSDGAAVLFFKLHRSLYCVCVEGVYHALHALALEVTGLGIELNVVRIGNLLNKN